MMLAGAMMLEHLEMQEQARRVRDAVRKTLQEKKTVTPDAGGTAKTHEFADAVVSNLR